jgi:hypothetical protein
VVVRAAVRPRVAGVVAGVAPVPVPFAMVAPSVTLSFLATFAFFVLFDFQFFAFAFFCFAFFRFVFRGFRVFAFDEDQRARLRQR